MSLPEKIKIKTEISKLEEELFRTLEENLTAEECLIEDHEKLIDRLCDEHRKPYSPAKKHSFNFLKDFNSWGLSLSENPNLTLKILSRFSYLRYSFFDILANSRLPWKFLRLLRDRVKDRCYADLCLSMNPSLNFECYSDPYVDWDVNRIVANNPNLTWEQIRSLQPGRIRGLSIWNRHITPELVLIHSESFDDAAFLDLTAHPNFNEEDLEGLSRYPWGRYARGVMFSSLEEYVRSRDSQDLSSMRNSDRYVQRHHDFYWMNSGPSEHIHIRWKHLLQAPDERWNIDHFLRNPQGRLQLEDLERNE